jgi:hypothetical protein
LSQGGQAINENMRYRVYLLGKEIKDPQTGQSLGNMESLCCDVVINRVTPNLSYGVLDDIKVDLSAAQPGALQVRESVPGKITARESAAEAPTEKTVTPKKTKAPSSVAKEKASNKVEKDDW